MPTEPASADPYAEDLAGDSPTFVRLKVLAPGRCDLLSTLDPGVLLDFALIAVSVPRGEAAESAALDWLEAVEAEARSVKVRLALYFQERANAREARR